MASSDSVTGVQPTCPVRSVRQTQCRTLIEIVTEASFCCCRFPNTLGNWFGTRMARNAEPLGFELLKELLTYDPTKRLNARDSLTHAWWGEAPKPHAKFVISCHVPLYDANPSFCSAFLGLSAGVHYPLRRVTTDDDPLTSSAPIVDRGKRARLG